MNFRFRMLVYSTVLILHISIVLMPNSIEHDLVSSILAFLTFFAFCLALLSADMVYKILSFTFVLFGSLILFYYDVPILLYIQHFGNMLNVLLLIAIAPLFVLPIQYGEYPKFIQILIKTKFDLRSHVYMIISGVNTLLASLMHYASITVTDSSLKGVLPDDKNNKLQSIAQSRGFCLAFLWSPVAALSSTAISETNANLLYTLPLMFTISVLIWIIDGLWTGRHVQRDIAISMEDYDQKNVFENNNRYLVKVIQFATVIVVFVVFLIFLQRVSSINLLDLVSLLILVTTLFWSVFLKKTFKFLRDAKELLTKTLPTLNSQFCLFLSVGFFLSCITSTHSIDKISSFLKILQVSFGSFFILFLVAVPFLLSMAGIVPVLSVSIVVQTIVPETIGVSNEWFTIGVIGGAVAGALSSPLLPPLNIVAKVNGISPYLLSRWNLKFSFFVLACCVVLVYILQLFFPDV